MSIASPDADDLAPRPDAGVPGKDYLVRSWDRGIGAAYISLFLSIVYLDQLAPWTVGVGGLGAGLAAAFVGAMLCAALAYLPARWGKDNRQPFRTLAASAFGTSGAHWFVGILQLIGQIIGSAVSLYLAADMALRALAAFRLIDDRWLEPIAREGLGLVNPAFLAVTIIWALFAATVGTLAVRLVAAIMFSYQVFPALVIGGLVVWAMPGLPSYQPIAGMPPPGGPPISQPGLWSFVVGVQLILGFFAPHALIAADWGVASREKRDVRMGILVGVGAAALVLATLAMIGVAGARGRSVRALEAPGAPRVGPELGPAGSEADAVRTHVLQEARGLALERWTVRGVLSNQIGDWIGGALLLILGVGLLGPVCYAPHQMSRTVQELRPGASKLVGPVLGALAAIPLIAVGFPSRLDRVFALTGALFAPVIGILWADALIHRGRWPGPAAGWRWPGIAAWIAGAAVGSFPLLGPRFGWGDWSRFQPAALFGLIAAWFIYLITSGISPWRTAHVAKADAVGPQPAPPAESPIP